MVWNLHNICMNHILPYFNSDFSLSHSKWFKIDLTIMLSTSWLNPVKLSRTVNIGKLFMNIFDKISLKIQSIKAAGLNTELQEWYNWYIPERMTFKCVFENAMFCQGWRYLSKTVFLKFSDEGRKDIQTTNNRRHTHESSQWALSVSRWAYEKADLVGSNYQITNEITGWIFTGQHCWVALCFTLFLRCKCLGQVGTLWYNDLKSLV